MPEPTIPESLRQLDTFSVDILVVESECTDCARKLEPYRAAFFRSKAEPPPRVGYVTCRACFDHRIAEQERLVREVMASGGGS